MNTKIDIVGGFIQIAACSSFVAIECVQHGRRTIVEVPTASLNGLVHKLNLIAGFVSE